MAAEREGWIGRLREVGLAFGALVSAELAGLADDLGRSGAALARALVLAAVAAGVVFWTLGLFVYFAIELLSLVMPRWGAVGVVLALFLVVGVSLVVVVKGKIVRIEPPTETVRRRLADTQAWWGTRIAPPDESPDREA
jgi:hypothetical protein